MFHVYRLNWYPGPVRMPGELRVAAFDTADEAHAEQQRLEEAARALVNPFAGGLAPVDQSNMPEPILCDWLRDHGIEPPAPNANTGKRPWASWWRASCGGWSPEQRSAAWGALDRMRFFEVVEEPERPVVYAITEADSHYAGGYYVGLASAYRTRSSAEQECARLNEGVEGWEFDEEQSPARQDPVAPFRGARAAEFEDRPNGFGPGDALFHLIVPIEVEGLPADELFAAARVLYPLGDPDPKGGGYRSPMEGGGAYTFVRGFSSRAAAEKFCREKTEQAHEAVAPGRIAPLGVGSEYDPETLVQKVRSLGLPPPEDSEELADNESCAGWWLTVATLATREQRIAIWELLFNEPLFEVLSVPLDD